MKKLTALILALAVCISATCLTVSAADTETLNEAHALKTLGLFRGSDKGLELDREPTRMEALIMLIRLMGKENEALAGQWEHPFTDAPTWQNAENYIGYAYENGLTNGVSETLFDPETAASAAECVTFTLRALGYADNETSTVWDNWETLGQQAAIYEKGEGAFTRGSAVNVYYAALESKMQPENTVSLAQKLIAESVFTQAEYETAKQIASGSVDLKNSSLETIMAAVYAGVEYDFSNMHMSNTVITADNAEYYLGTSDIKFKEALASEPMMMAMAHSVCLVRLEDDQDSQKAMEEIKANVDPRKWICVGVDEENVRTAAVGNLVILVMDNNCPQELINSFLTLEK